MDNYYEQKLLEVASWLTRDVMKSSKSINGGSFAVTACKSAAKYTSNTPIINWMLKQEKDMGLETPKPYRDFEERVYRHRDNLKNLIKIGGEFDRRIKEKADKFAKDQIVYCKTKQELKKAIEDKKIAKVDFCSIEKSGEKCAEYIEKEIGAEIRGVMGNIKEIPKGNCVICGRKADEVVYIGKSY